MLVPMRRLVSPVAWLAMATTFSAAMVSKAAAADPFRDTLVPFVKEFCAECHNAKTAEAQLDLTKYASAAQASDDFRQWEHVATFLRKGEMPPPDAPQPPEKQRQAAIAAVESLLRTQAMQMAGDPGPVLPRRLTNAEYNYTVRDLTGVDIRPTDSFPVDPASGEGFNNTGEALSMSPSLFKKYYAAAQHISDHLLMTPTRLEFAPHPVTTFADQKKHVEQAILKLYDDHRVDLEACLTALWSYRHRPAEAQDVTVEEWAARHGQSPKYLALLWDALAKPSEKDRLWMRWLHARWLAIPTPPSEAELRPTGEAQRRLKSLASDLRKLSLELCVPETQAIVSNAGNGPIQHIDRRKKTARSRDQFHAESLADHQRLHLELRPTKDATSLRVVFHAAPVGEANVGEAKEPGVVLLSELTLSAAGPQQYRPNDAGKNRSLLDVLREFSPETVKSLPFGKESAGGKPAPDTLVVASPGTIEIEIPAKAFEERKDFHVYAEARLDSQRTPTGAVQIVMQDRHRAEDDSLLAIPLVDPRSDIAAEIAASGSAFCRLFPNRFYFADDTRGLSAGFHLIEGFFRDDQPLQRLVLSEDENAQLDRLWSELEFVTGITEKMLRGFVFFERSERNFLKHPDFDSIKEEDPYLTTPEVLAKFERIYLSRSNVKGTPEESAAHPIHLFFEDIREGLSRRARQRSEAQAIYRAQLREFAQRAWRRPLTAKETEAADAFFDSLCANPEYGLEQAARASVLRTLVSPHFCYRMDPTPAGDTVAALSDLALASRLSYFLWSSMPDEELLAVARAGKLNDDATLKAQARRMLKDPKVSGFALEFFGQWLGYRDFLQQESVNRTAFPAFDDALRQAMFEEPTRFITDAIQRNEPITRLLSSETTLVNRKLRQHYGIPFPGGSTDEWVPVPGMSQHGRGGLLGMAVFLTKNSQPQRTSPVKRGFWVVHKVLGEHIPPPPPDVAVLPAKETDTAGKTIRQLLTLHTDDNRCARCHVRFDPIGLSMEGFDAIGKARAKDLAGRPIDNVVTLPDGNEARGVAEFSRWLAVHRRHDFTRTLNQKLLGYALGRSLQLSDQPLLEEMQARLDADEDRIEALILAVVSSRQFRTQRCRDFTMAAYRNALKENNR